MHQAYKALTILHRNKLIYIINNFIYNKINYKKFKRIIKNKKIMQIQKWYIYHRNRRYIKAATKIILYVRVWLAKRKKSAYIILNYFKCNLIKRKRKNRILIRYVLCICIYLVLLFLISSINCNILYMYI